MDIDTENDFSVFNDEDDDYWYIYSFIKNPEIEKIANKDERASKYMELKDKCSMMYKLNPNKDEVIIKSFTSDC